ncbi:hypothetical protein KPY62_11635 [Psychrobacter sp. TAE2020]|uniref:hypothetical protein n=1 Tax=Psychrobacter sp. TAE2020 TaxID=2846762 RepID=UPI001C1255CC|nr:hypothetical protein [Psychrobacter sp. TAE2020]MBU5617728.1 hypothetical protein [Psychrobacter sp. TAE2020]
MSTSNNEADMQNPNKVTDGTKKAYDQAQCNKGKQLNPQEPKNDAQPQKED